MYACVRDEMREGGRAVGQERENESVCVKRNKSPTFLLLDPDLTIYRKRASEYEVHSAVDLDGHCHTDHLA